MRGWRISIAELMGIMVIAALTVAAAREADNPWETASAGLVIAIFLWSTFRAGLGPVAGRRFWFGFSAFGWAHFLILGSRFEDVLPSIYLVDQLWDSIWEFFKADATSPKDQSALRSVLDDLVMMFLILSSLAVALIGGLVASRRRPKRRGLA